MPQPISFDVNDLDGSLSDQTSGSESSSQSSRDSQSKVRDNRHDNWSLPSAPNTTGTSSSSTGGTSSSTAAVCPINVMLALNDNIALGRYAEVQGLFLPDPPGTGLLRPPRA